MLPRDPSRLEGGTGGAYHCLGSLGPRGLGSGVSPAPQQQGALAPVHLTCAGGRLTGAKKDSKESRHTPTLGSRQQDCREDPSDSQHPPPLCPALPGLSALLSSTPLHSAWGICTSLAGLARPSPWAPGCIYTQGVITVLPCSVPRGAAGPISVEPGACQSRVSVPSSPLCTMMEP